MPDETTAPVEQAVDSEKENLRKQRKSLKLFLLMLMFNL
jgi:hypothetical protein